VKDAATMILKGGEINVEIERLLWYGFMKKQMWGESISSQFICNRAREIFEDLKRKPPQSSGSQFEEARGGSKNLGGELKWKVWLGMGRLPVQIKKVQRNVR
jgi:hypothetical protein